MSILTRFKRADLESYRNWLAARLGDDPRHNSTRRILDEVEIELSTRTAEPPDPLPAPQIPPWIKIDGENNL